MKLKGTFKIGDLEITDITYSVNSVTDRIKDKVCSVEVIFKDEKIKHSRSIDGFTYTTTWDDIDIEEWVTNELKGLEI